jgi:hypothetical protein
MPSGCWPPQFVTSAEADAIGVKAARATTISATKASLTALLQISPRGLIKWDLKIRPGAALCL